MVKNLFLLSSSQKPTKPRECESGLGWVFRLQAVAPVTEETPQQDEDWRTEIRNGLSGKAREGQPGEAQTAWRLLGAIRGERAFPIRP